MKRALIAAFFSGLAIFGMNLRANASAPTTQPYDLQEQRIRDELKQLDALARAAISAATQPSDVTEPVVGNRIKALEARIVSLRDRLLELQILRGEFPGQPKFQLASPPDQSHAGWNERHINGVEYYVVPIE